MTTLMAAVPVQGFMPSPGLTEEEVFAQLDAMRGDIRSRKQAAMQAWSQLKNPGQQPASPERAPVGRFTAGLLKQSEW